MLFPTIDFLVFFGVVFPITWVLNTRNEYKKSFLLIVSYLFYSFWDWHFVFLLFASSTGNYVAGLCIEASRGPVARKAVMGAAVAANLSTLAYFKYYDFLAAELTNLATALGLNLDLGSAGVALPIAISFLTFHGLSYVIDVGRGNVRASRSLLDLMLYIAFFPHLVAGPIVRAADFLKQLSRPSSAEDVDLAGSMLLVLGGLIKKVVIASHISAQFVDPIFTNPADFNRTDLFLGVYAYAVVIYCDFSAYTDIAIGVADLLGYRFPQNFNQPYRALSLQDFWRRWHMSLSSWLRDYLYIPLGGSRGGELATYRNLMLTMVLGGLWHGAGLQFVIWGFMHGLGLAVERLVRAHAGIDLEQGGLATRLLGWLVTFNFVCIAWIFFRSPSLEGVLGYVRAAWADRDAPSTVTPFVLALMAVGFATQFIPPSVYAGIRLVYERSSIPVKVAVPTFVVWITAVLAPAGIPPFIYFQF